MNDRLVKSLLFCCQLCEAPSPAATKAWLQDTATQEQINLAGKVSTSNKLVYMECLAGICFYPIVEMCTYLLRTWLV